MAPPGGPGQIAVDGVASPGCGQAISGRSARDGGRGRRLSRLCFWEPGGACERRRPHLSEEASFPAVASSCRRRDMGVGSADAYPWRESAPTRRAVCAGERRRRVGLPGRGPRPLCRLRSRACLAGGAPVWSGPKLCLCPGRRAVVRQCRGADERAQAGPAPPSCPHAPTPARHRLLFAASRFLPRRRRAGGVGGDHGADVASRPSSAASLLAPPPAPKRHRRPRRERRHDTGRNQSLSPPPSGRAVRPPSTGPQFGFL